MCLLIYLLSIWSGYPPSEMVWRWGRVQCYGYWPSWPKPRRPVQLLHPEVLFKNSFNACRSVGKNPMFSKKVDFVGIVNILLLITPPPPPQQNKESMLGKYGFHTDVFLLLLLYVDKQSWVSALTGFSSPWYKAWQLFNGFRPQSKSGYLFSFFFDKLKCYSNHWINFTYVK